MREFEKKKTQNHIQIKRSVRTTPRKDTKQVDRNDRKVQSVRESDKLITNAVVSYKEVGTEPPYVSVKNQDAVNISEGVVDEHNARPVDGSSAELKRENIMVKEEDSDPETATDSVSSSQGDSLPVSEEKVVPNVNDEKVADPYRVPQKKDDEEGGAREIENIAYSSSEYSSKSVEDISAEEQGETFSDAALDGDEGTTSDVELPNGFHLGHTYSESRASDEVKSCNDSAEEAIKNEELLGRLVTYHSNIDEMITKIEKLEEELREVAALEISLYAIVPEHGSSSHKVHTPARRLSRLYIHACKHWTQSKRATIARSTVSGLILIARTCGNDVSRLTFWLSNTVALREIIAQAFGISSGSNATRVSLLNGNNQVGKKRALQLAEDWQETSTFVSALEKVESWVFSRIVESVWWQALAPHMQSPDSGSVRRSSRPAPSDEKQGNFSVDLWTDAFIDALHRLCPLRAAGHECGCLPALARMVISQCGSRLDVAMFNAILRESEHEIPSDPVSDPILDTRALPIAAGDLSFGSGAQLKKAVGNWSRCLDDLFGTSARYPSESHHAGRRDDNEHAKLKWFHLLDELSDLLMLPKDMLVDRSIRTEVCPSISLSLVKRIACNFTPDEFCPDHVPGEVLEVLNVESISERRSSGDSASSFPYSATPVEYSPPSTADVAEKVAEAARGKPQLEHNASMIQTKGYTSDEELEELDSPMAYVVDNLLSMNGSLHHEELSGHPVVNARYKLLHEIWSL